MRDQLRALLTTFSATACRYVVTVNSKTSNLESGASVINDYTAAFTQKPTAAVPNAQYVANVGRIDWDAWVKAQANPSSFFSDGIHPNDAGKAELAKLYQAALTRTANPFVTLCN